MLAGRNACAARLGGLLTFFCIYPKHQLHVFFREGQVFPERGRILLSCHIVRDFEDGPGVLK